MKITLTKFDVLKILVLHFSVDKYEVERAGGKPEFQLLYDEIYWEGNPESKKAENESK